MNENLKDLLFLFTAVAITGLTLFVIDSTYVSKDNFCVDNFGEDIRTITQNTIYYDGGECCADYVKLKDGSFVDWTYCVPIMEE